MFIGWRNWTNSKRLCARKSSTTSRLNNIPKKELATRVGFSAQFSAIG
jgi:hypothetical protein